MILIAAMSEDRVIGRGDGLPWDVPEEYAQFLEFVRGGTVLMGRRTWEIFGGDLTSRHNVVLSRSRVALPGATVEPDLPGALARARALGGTLFVAGGARVYAQTLPLADRMLLSTIRGAYEGDARFPAFDPADWFPFETREEPRFVFVDWRRRPGRSRPATPVSIR